MRVGQPSERVVQRGDWLCQRPLRVLQASDDCPEAVAEKRDPVGTRLQKREDVAPGQGLGRMSVLQGRRHVESLLDPQLCQRSVKRVFCVDELVRSCLDSGLDRLDGGPESSSSCQTMVTTAQVDEIFFVLKRDSRDDTRERPSK